MSEERKCPKCNGVGMIDEYGIYGLTDESPYISCSTCKGKGFLKTEEVNHD